MSDSVTQGARLHVVKSAPELIENAAVSANQEARDAVETARAADPADLDESVVEALASRILHGWLRNRQQLLVPFNIDLQKLEASQVSTLLQAMSAAAQADASAPEATQPRLKAALEAVNASATQSSELEQTLAHPSALHQTLAQVADVQGGALFYAASLLAIDRRKLVNRQYLRYLAARLQLPRALTRALEQRYVAAAQSSVVDA